MTAFLNVPWLVLTALLHCPTRIGGADGCIEWAETSHLIGDGASPAWLHSERYPHNGKSAIPTKDSLGSKRLISRCHGR